MNISNLQAERLKYMPKVPKILKENFSNICVQYGNKTESKSDTEAIKKLFPNTYGLPEIIFKKGKGDDEKNIHNVGVILSGGQAPGGHNVICGLFDALKKADNNNKLYGFLGGPSGILDDKYIILTKDIIDSYRNTGGFDMIQSGRTKLETEEQFDICLKVCKKHDITSIVIIGGDDSNTNAAILAEYFKSKNANISVIGCPKTIDGDLKNDKIETSFGFDTACKTYSELIGNIQRDANSSRKYWHFIRLMGRSASHIALECALQTQPNICLIGEEIFEKNLKLSDIVDYISDIIVKRSEKGLNYGICLVPEGLIEFIPSLNHLIYELNDILSKDGAESTISYVCSNLSDTDKAVFLTLPEEIKKQLLMERDPHGNVQVSLIETEKLLISLISDKLNNLKEQGKYKGKFVPHSHFFGYEGRCAFPSNFDSDYCYSLGYNAFLLIKNGFTGYLSSISNLSDSSDNWICGGTPITMMMNLEQRHGKSKPVIKKALVELDGNVFGFFKENRDKWAINNDYTYPGSIQYFGPDIICNATTKTLELENIHK